MLKRLLSLLLCLTMVISMVPVQAFAVENEPESSEAVEEFFEESTVAAEMEAIAEEESVFVEETVGATVETTEPTEEPEETQEETQEETLPVIAETEAGTDPTREPASEDASSAPEEEVPVTGTCGDNLTWTLDNEGTLTILGEGAMPDYTSVDEQPWKAYKDQIKALVLSEHVTTVGSFAFSGLKQLKTITFPEITAIGKEAFSECESLTSLVLPDSVELVGEYAFSACLTLRNAVLPKGLQHIPKGMFVRCVELQTVRYPEALVSIGEFAFGSCYGLYGPVLPEGLKTIGESAFSWCGATDSYHWYYDCSNFQSVTLPSTLETISDTAFFRCENLNSITIPDNVTNIGERAFAYCYDLRSVTISAGIETIGEGAFFQNKELDEVTFRWNAPEIGSDAFGTNTLTCYFPGSNTEWTEDKLQNYGGRITWKPYGSPCDDGHTEVVDKGVPATCTEDGLTEGKHCSVCGKVLVAQEVIPAMGHKEVIVEAIAPTCTEDGLTEGKHCSVCGKVLMAQEVIPAGHNVVNEVCTGCGVYGTCGEKLVWTLDTSARKLTISGQGAMNDYPGSSGPWKGKKNYVKHLVIEEGVTNVGISAFRLYNIASIKLPEGLTTIGKYAFEGNGALITLELPDSLEEIQYCAFYDSSLNTITIPANLKRIGVTAFLGTNLREITFLGDAPAITDEVFYLLRPTAYYPAGNSTWTEEVRAKFGGTTTWIAVCSEHREVIDQAVSSTCTETGLTEGKHCDICGEVLAAQEVIPALGHDFVKGICSRCGERSKCGENLTWALDENGVLTISGSGAMYDFTATEQAPWYDLRTEVKELIIEDGVTTIGSYAFYGCKNLTSVVIPASVVSIGAYAFGDCSNLKDLEVPETVDKVDSTAWSGSGIGSVVIGGDPIEEDDFESYEGISDIWFRGDFPGIGENAFRNLVATAHYPADNATWTADKLLDYGGTITWKPYCLGEHTVETDEAVAPTCIGVGLTEGSHCSVCGEIFLAQEEIPATGIHDYVDTVCTYCGAIGGIFDENFSWTLVDGTLTIFGTGEMPWGDINGIIKEPWLDYEDQITSVVIEEGITDIGYAVFCQLKNLQSVTIAESVKTVEESAFAQCPSLEQIDLPDSIETIEQLAFFGCDSLEQVKLPNSITEISYGAFANCSSLQEIEIPENVQKIVQHAFLNTGLTQITIPDQVTLVDYGAFAECTQLEQVVFGENIVEIMDFAFEHCTALTQLDLPAFVERIGDRAFTYCTGLNRVTLPADLGSISEGAFYGSHNLNVLTVPATVQNLGYCAFRPFVFATEIHFAGNAPSFHENTFIGETLTAYYPDNATWTPAVMQDYGGNITWRSESGEHTHSFDESHKCACGAIGGSCGENLTWILLDGVLTIYGTGAMTEYSSSWDIPWYDCEIETVIIQKGVTTIGPNAFRGCSDLKSIEIPDGVISIGNYAFNGCDKLATIEIPASVTSISQNAFFGCEGLEEIRVDSANPNYSTDASGVLFNKEQTYLMKAPVKLAGTYRMPDSVRVIQGYAFDECKELQAVTFPVGLRNIEYCAFAGCSKLGSIDLPESVVVIDQSAFSRCGFTAVTIPSSVVYIGRYAFDSESLREIRVHSENANFSSDDAGALLNKDKTTLIAVPGGIEGEYAVPDTVTHIGDYAFDGYGKITRIHVPASVTVLGEKPFPSTGSKYMSVIFYGDVPQFTTVFDSYGNETVTVQYPVGNETWTEEVKEAFGEGLNWLAFDPSAKTSGSCGENLTWSVDDGVLTISGTGDMESWDGISCFAPWVTFGDQIHTVKIGADVTSVGNRAFILTNVRTIHFSGNAPEIGNNILNTDYSDLTFVCYYPADCEGWDEVIKKNPLFQWIPIGDATATTLLEIADNCENMTSDEIIAAVQAVNREELLKGMQEGRYAQALQNIAAAVEGHPELEITQNVVGAQFLDSFWSGVTGAELNSFDTDNSPRKMILDAPAITAQVPAGYDAENISHFSVTLEDVRNPSAYAVPVFLYFTLNEAQNPFFLDVFAIDETTGAAEKIPSWISWSKVGMVLEFVVPGDGEYMIAHRLNGSVSGQCGDNLSWCYEDNGVLTISGSGEMYDYGRISNVSPWYYYREEVYTIRIDERVTSIGDYAFNDCRFVNDIHIPASVKKIGEGAFYYLHNRNIVFAGDAPKFHDQTFIDMSANVFYPADNDTWTDAITKQYGAGKYDLEWIPYGSSADCGDNLAWAFEESTGTLTISGTGDMWDYYSDETRVPWTPYCTQISKIILEEGVTSIGACAFCECYYVQEILLPDSLLSISDGALPSVASITIPAGVENLSADSGIMAIPNVTIDPENQHYSYMDGVLFNRDKTVLLRFNSDKGGRYCIPDSVVEIAPYAFYCCYMLEAVEFGQNVAAIGYDAFTWCSALTEMKFAGNAPAIAETAFWDVTATSYYPMDDPTWTADVMQHYEGYLTWVPYGEEPLKFTLQPIDYLGALNSYASFSVATNKEDVTYQWFYSSDNGVTWKKSGSTGFNTDTLTVQVKDYRLGQLYRCEITDSDGNVVTSDAASMMLPPSTIQIVTQPADISGAPAEKIPFTVEATGEGLTYLWYYSPDNGNTWAQSWSEGYNAATVYPVLRAYNSGRMFKCLITDINGNTEWTEAAKMVIESSEVVIKSQPVSYEGAVNDLAEFTVVAEGVNLEYAWYYSQDNGVTWTETYNNGYNTPTVQVRLYGYRSGWQYKCLITSGNSLTVETEAATIALRPATAKISSQPLNAGGAIDQYVSFHVGASGSGLEYQWQFSSDGGSTWGDSTQADAKTDTFRVQVKSYRDGYLYRCRLTDDSGVSIYTNTVILRVGAMPVITGQPESYTGAAGETAVFTVEVSGENLQYQWQYSNNGGETWVNSGSAGYNTKSLSVGLAGYRSGQQYHCVITNEYGSVISDAAVLTVS